MDLLDIFDDDTPEPQPKPDPALVDSANIAYDFKLDLLDWLVNGKTEPPRAPGLHCSSLWKTCARVPMLEAKYSKFLTVEQITAGQRMTFDTGHTLHHLMQNAYLGPFGRLWGKWKCLSCQKITHEGTMPAACPVCDTPWRDEKDGIQNIVYDEMFVSVDDLKYCGHCDGIMLTRSGRKVVFEFKTISKSQYGSLKAPKHEHVIQVHAYMYGLGFKDAIVAYWDKGSQCDWSREKDGTWTSTNPHLKVFHVKWDDDIWAGVVKRIQDYHRAEERVKTLPTVEIENINEFHRVCSHKKCNLASGCHVRDLCFAI